MTWLETDAALFVVVLGRDVARHLATMPPHLNRAVVSKLAELPAHHGAVYLDEPAASASAELQALLNGIQRSTLVYANIRSKLT